jgi:uncharacterized protein (DUF697 family)
MNPIPPKAEPAAEKAHWQVVDDTSNKESPGRAGWWRGPAAQAPQDDLQTIAQRCRKRVTQRALVAAGVAVVPIPGLDWAADVGLLMRLLPQINAEFGLSPEQIERLAPDRRVVVFKAISAGGGLLVGKLITRELVLHMVKLVGVRLTAQQAAKFVPLAGQAVSALLTFSAMRFVCEQHIRQCMDVARQVQLLDTK